MSTILTILKKLKVLTMSTLLTEITLSSGELILHMLLATQYLHYSTIYAILTLFIKEYLCYLRSIFKRTCTVLRLLTTYLRFVRVSIKSKDEKIKVKEKGH